MEQVSPKVTSIEMRLVSIQQAIHLRRRSQLFSQYSDGLFTARLDFLFGRHEAVEEQAEKSDVHAYEEHHVHGLVATCPVIGGKRMLAYPSEDSLIVRGGGSGCLNWKAVHRMGSGETVAT